MSRTITIDPVTRIEGHSKITIQLDERGEVADAHFHVTQFRGFERITQGRPVHELPAIMARICGICPVSHLVASAKAVDDILAVEPPPAGADLRRLINLGQIVQSNALSFFHLSSPDLLFGFDADPAKRHIVALAGENPQLAKDGIALRKWGQEIIELLGGKRIHPGGVIPGGVADQLTEEVRDRILAGVPEAIAQTERAITWYKEQMQGWEEEASVFGNFRSAFMGLVDDDGNVDHYGGKLRIIDADGAALVDGADPKDFNAYIGEAVEPWSYLKSTYYKPMGYPDGIYRVGPLARMNIAKATGTPRADEELQKFRWRVGRVAGSSFHYHYARLIDMLHCVEKVEQILRGPEIMSSHTYATAGINRNEGIGVSEAPRGTLMHHYKVDDDGLVEWVNLVIATGHNNMAMNRSVQQVAKHHIKGDKIEEPMLNRVEAVIRCYDPCLSCSTHALGDMALDIELRAPDGEVLDRVKR
jgi:NAD-reducing hydrogenase large subunit